MNEDFDFYICLFVLAKAVYFVFIFSKAHHNYHLNVTFQAYEVNAIKFTVDISLVG